MTREQIHVVAILDRSEGNAETGEAWQETAIFSAGTEVFDILRWAIERKRQHHVSDFRGRLQIAIAQIPLEGEPR